METLRWTHALTCMLEIDAEMGDTHVNICVRKMTLKWGTHVLTCTLEIDVEMDTRVNIYVTS